MKNLYVVELSSSELVFGTHTQTFKSKRKAMEAYKKMLNYISHYKYYRLEIYIRKSIKIEKRDHE